MSGADLDAIEALAKAATPGPWVVDDEGHRFTGEGGSSTPWRADARYLAMLSPDVVLALCAELRRARLKVSALIDLANHLFVLLQAMAEALGEHGYRGDDGKVVMRDGGTP